MYANTYTMLTPTLDQDKTLFPRLLISLTCFDCNTLVSMLACAVAVFLFCVLQVRLCDVIPVWAPTMMTATGKAPNLVPATQMRALWWWAMTVSPTVTV